jgi:hypothetical protein
LRKGDRNVADETKIEEEKSSLLSKILTPVLLAVLAGGTSPWWFNALRGKSEQKQVSVAPSIISQPPAVSQGEPATTASRDFFVGRWQVSQETAAGSGMNTVDYYDNGKFEGHALVVSGEQGRNIGESGTWQVEILSAQSFRLRLLFDNGSQWTGKFKIIDKDHIHNLDENYIAERVN